MASERIRIGQLALALQRCVPWDRRRKDQTERAFTLDAPLQNGRWTDL